MKAIITIKPETCPEVALKIETIEPFTVIEKNDNLEKAEEILIQSLSVDEMQQTRLIVDCVDIDINNRNMLNEIKSKISAIENVIDVELEGVKDESYYKRHYNIFVDIDGTITNNSTPREEQKTYQVFQTMQKLGHDIYLNSGRPQQEAIDIMERVSPDRIRGIIEYGAALVLSNTQRYTISDKQFCEDAFPKLVEGFIEKYGKTKIFTINNEGEARISSIKFDVEDMEKNALNEDEMKEIKENLDKIIQEKGLKISLIKGRRNKIHLIEDKCSKGKAIGKLKDLKKIANRAHEAAIGDSEIDIPMFEVCNESFVLANATDELKQFALQSNCYITKKDFLWGVMDVFNYLDDSFHQNEFK